ncbi:putative inactive serine/threonine-protein kinase bub1 [Drosera capensis]
MVSNANNDLFPSLVNDIKSYTGADPLFPWLRGVRRLRDSLSPNLLKEKLPRFLQKCAQTFEMDQRYKNDVRYIQIWLQLMDYVENPRGILRKMERNGIGTKLSLFYQAYALYYEKLKRFEEAEKIYRLGALK